ncbi:MAG: hypothetical protein LBK52_04450, partial [Deltaproteobacteria bacterium]|nr:hypothetical protein [Deltaproteobacteria bacterium]
MTACPEESPRFVETIKNLGGRYYSLDLHQERMERTVRKHFGSGLGLNLAEVLPQIEGPELTKVRAVYGRSGPKTAKETAPETAPEITLEITIEPYVFPRLEKVHLVSS